ncbi:AIM24 family protein [Sneathiella marina]|uniref:AIM24 family protein n=1 Tax=Sneathiella marina TaxID=2950108 RepID=A0ABY4W566_9PROT|nr:AIM24 family protein [Sneathiella marina]USG61964.1 AIM24 family protein [Sneathiella marina]
MLIFNNKIYQNLFWLTVLLGTVPAAVSATLPPTHWCLNFSDIAALFEIPSVGCFGGSSIAPEFLVKPFTWVYLGLFAAGVFLCFATRKFLAVIALAPLLLLFFSPLTEMSVYPEDHITADYFEPKRQQTASSIEKIVLDVVPAFRTAPATAENQFGALVLATDTAKGNANRYWKAVKSHKKARNSLGAAEEKDKEIAKKLDTAQSAYEKMSRLPFQSKKVKAKLADFKKAIDDFEKRRGSNVQAVKNRIHQYSEARKQYSTDLILSLTQLNVQLDKTLSTAPNQNTRLWTLIISAASLAALLCFAIGSRIRTPQFAAACLIILVVTLNPFSRVEEGGSIAHVFFAFFLSTYPLVLFIVSAVLLRLLVLGVVQNLPILRQMSQRRFLLYSLLTVFLWIPIGLSLAAGLWLSFYVDTRAQDAVYGIECTNDGVGLFECDGPTSDKLVTRGEDSNLELDIYTSVDIAFKNQELQLEDMLAKYRSLAKKSKKQIPEFVETQYVSIFPARQDLINNISSLKPPSCKLHQITCNVIRNVKISILDAYMSIRNRQLRKLNDLTSDLANLSGDAADKQLREIELYLSATLDTIKRGVRNTIADVFWTVRTLNLLANMILLIAAIKSFAYIFGRIAFKNETGHALPIELQNEAPSSSPAPARIRTGFDPEYIFKSANREHYYIKPALSPSGKSQGVAWPQPFKAALRRLFTGTYKMVKVEVVENNKDTISIQTSQGRQFLEWTLQDGERVYFSQGNLAAFSETVGLSTHISLSLTAMAFGRMFFSVAEGPGILILRTYGKPEIYTSPDTARSIDPLRFIGWTDVARFHVNSSSTPWNVYFHSAQMSFSGGGAAIGDVSENGKRGAGAVRFIPPVFIPF